MRRIARALPGIFVLIAGSSALARKPPPPRPTCEKTSAGFSQRQADWEAFSKKSFEDALDQAGLTIPKMTPRTLQPQDAMLKGVKPGATFKMGDGVSVYIRTVQGYGFSQEFVQDAQSVVHPLVRKENLVGTEAHTLCGCGPMGGGAVPPMLALVYTLPPGTTYNAKPIEVGYDAKHIEIRWRNVVDGKDVMCEPPP
jgi:hypothetical protein